MFSDTPAIVVVHASAALSALVIGGYQLFAGKGTGGHRAIGYVWTSLMMLVALSSFWIHDIRQFGPFSVIHVLSAYVAVGLPLAILAARRGSIKRHKSSMQGLYLGGLIVAGVFTLSPGRVLGKLVFGW